MSVQAAFEAIQYAKQAHQWRQIAEERAAIIQRVRDVHNAETGDMGKHGNQWCGECGTPYPCRTITAIDGDA